MSIKIRNKAKMSINTMFFLIFCSVRFFPMQYHVKYFKNELIINDKIFICKKYMHRNSRIHSSF